jgi:hypothetical protein
MPAARILDIAGGKTLIEDDVGGQRSAPVKPLEQVMADQRVLGNAALDAALERRDLIDALADEDPRTEQVLVDVGNGRE